MKPLFRISLFALIFVLVYFCISVLSAFFYPFFSQVSNPMLLQMLFIYLLSYGLPALIYAWILKRKTGQPIASQLGFCRISLKSLLLTIGAAIAVQPFFMLLSSITQLFFKNITTATMQTMAQMPLWALLLSSAILPAIFEELIFRGVIYQGCRTNTPGWYSLLISALFFGLLHLNFQQSLYAFVAGFFLALLVKATGSLWASITAHLVINGLQSLLSWFALQSSTAAELAEIEALPSGFSAFLSLVPYLFLTAITLPLVILCLRALFQLNRHSESAALQVKPRLSTDWHKGAWLMYVVLGLLFLYTLATEVILRLV